MPDDRVLSIGCVSHPGKACLTAGVFPSLFFPVTVPAATKTSGKFLFRDLTLWLSNYFRCVRYLPLFIPPARRLKTSPYRRRG